jgi:hypothetical protein
MKDLLAMVGLVLLLEGLPYFIAPGVMRRVMAKIPQMEEGRLRLVGVASAAVGLLLVYLGRS